MQLVNGGHQLGESDEGRLDVLGISGGGHPGSPGDSLSAVLALPNPDRLLLQPFLITATFPQNPQMYLACDEISYFRAIFLRAPPYRVPYFPVIPTFLVRFDMALYFLPHAV